MTLKKRCDMPWTPSSFRERRNKKLSNGQAARAAAIANAVRDRELKAGKSEKEADAVAAKTANSKMKKLRSKKLLAKMYGDKT